MAYKISSSDSHKLVLAREEVKGAMYLFIGVGTLFFLVGVALNFFLEDWEMPFLMFKVLFPLFGALAIFGGLRLPKHTRETLPEMVVFDHDLGAVVLEMDQTTRQRGYIRYEEITGFDIHVEMHRSSGKTNSTYYTYHVYLLKKDGGQWHLFKFNVESKARAFMTELAAQIPLHKPSRVTEQATISPKIERKEGAGKTIIHWQNKVSAINIFALTAFSSIFIFMMGGFFSLAGDMQIFLFIVLGFILLVFVLVIGSILKKWIKDATTRFAVAVDVAHLEYYEFSKKSGQVRNVKKLPLADVQSITYTFIPWQNNVNSGLRVYTRQQAEHAEAIKDKPLEALKDLFKGNQPIVLSITALNPVECLQLENWLQELILKRANVVVQ